MCGNTFGDLRKKERGLLDQEGVKYNNDDLMNKSPLLTMLQRLHVIRCWDINEPLGRDLYASNAECVIKNILGAQS